MKKMKVTVLGLWSSAHIGETPSFLIETDQANILLDNVHAGLFLDQTFDVIEKTFKSISRPIKTELLAAIEDLMSRISGDELNKTKAFLEKLKK